jgi:hypothetical protein
MGRILTISDLVLRTEGVGWVLMNWVSIMGGTYWGSVGLCDPWLWGQLMHMYVCMYIYIYTYIHNILIIISYIIIIILIIIYIYTHNVCWCSVTYNLRQTKCWLGIGLNSGDRPVNLCFDIWCCAVNRMETPKVHQL